MYGIYELKHVLTLASLDEFELILLNEVHFGSDYSSIILINLTLFQAQNLSGIMKQQFDKKKVRLRQRDQVTPPSHAAAKQLLAYHRRRRWCIFVATTNNYDDMS